MIQQLSNYKTIVPESNNTWQYYVIFLETQIEENCNLLANVLVESDVVIGNNFTVKSGVQLCNEIIIEDNMFIGPNATFTNNSFPRSKNPDWKFSKTVIKKSAASGANATIRCGITIGENAMIGTGIVVTKEIPADELWVGNPARFVRCIDGWGDCEVFSYFIKQMCSSYELRSVA